MTPAQICSAAADWYEVPGHKLIKDMFLDGPLGTPREEMKAACGSGSFYLVCESAVDRDRALGAVKRLLGKSIVAWTDKDCKDKAHMIRMLRRAAERLAESE